MLNDILQVLRDHGWSETGPDHDPARWLRDHFTDLTDSEQAVIEAERAVEAAEEDKHTAEHEAETLKDKLTTLLRDIEIAVGDATKP